MGSNIIELAKLGHERAAELKASSGAVDVRSLAQLISDLATQLEVQFVRSTDMAVQLANAESKCRELAEEISRRDEIFVPVYPDENTMNRMTDVFHDTAKIHCDEDSIFVDNAELVITAIINHYIKSDDAFLAEVRAQGVEIYADNLDSSADDAERDGFDDAVKFLRSEASGVRLFAAQLRQEAAQ
ncbi:hypothetical protein KQN34_001295 [Salmonella enterica subsp. enterica serovar Muenchen]|nr:hypothetical protein [Salmonella enterica subsp. enterica serovar Muenchen]EHQ0640098.1 hypothetical protein [Salmonella enterica subsp. enterica serovar Muenchen]EIJ4894208.1 hypothetical protein [Salmonella enterica subsp. enterica serovar Muenchen]EJF4001026.1 hypothetical protein [Salmonella enterica subsp. enterica serovar Muenchen]ELY1302677.1 hypothetical protein [Salmonella enterica subsp. enterica serovar Muenchen]